MSNTAMDIWINEIKEIMKYARIKVASDVNQTMIETYWKNYVYYIPDKEELIKEVAQLVEQEQLEVGAEDED